MKQVFFSLIFIYSLITPAFSQRGELVKIGELQYVNLADKLSEDLTSTRSAVVISVSPDSGRYITRGKWTELAKATHKNFRKIGIDAILYVNQDDLNAGPEVKQAYQKIFTQRNVRNLIHVDENKKGYNSSYSLLVTPFHPEGFVENGQNAWQEGSAELDQVFLRLGRQILRQDMERSNFLIPEHPEYLTDIKIFQGTRLENFPSRLKSLPLAVVAFQKASTENISDAEVLKKIEKYNLQISRKNEELAEIMKGYPFKYEIVEESNEDALYQRGFQYALMPMSSSASSIKKILNFQTIRSETVYISSVMDATDSVKLLKRMPVQANVTKYYIKQTIVKDVHTGDVWDADVTWQKALTNFIFHLKAAFK